MTMNCHVGVMCNNCTRDDFPGMRYKCLRCDDYDLCSRCYNLNRHNQHHPMQHILLPHERFNLLLTCPYCITLDLTASTLHAHVLEQHRTETATKVLCPICVINPYCHPNFMLTNLAKHLTLAHFVGCPQTVRPLQFALHELPSGSARPLLENFVDPQVQNNSEDLQEIQSQAALEDVSESSS